MTTKPDKPEPLPTRVPAKEFARHIGHYQRQALTQPITITAHDRPSLVVLSVEEYQRLMRRDRKALRVEELSDEELDAIAAYRPEPEDAAFDHEDDLKP
jgi:prevent-host-death family protein